MKKYIRLLIVSVLVITSVLIASTHPSWASIIPAGENSSGVYAPNQYHIELNGIGAHNGNNIGGVCTYDVEFKVDGVRVVADAEVPLSESKIVPFTGEGNLLFPGCRFTYYKKDANNQEVLSTSLASADGSSTVCFGIDPANYYKTTVYYYVNATGNRVWIQLPSTTSADGRLVCASAPYAGVYMPVGDFVPEGNELPPGQNPFFPNGLGGSIQPPPDSVTITQSGTYAVGGICILETLYKVTGLSDTIVVQYPRNNRYTENTLTIPSDSIEGVNGIFFWPGCHVTHYLQTGTTNTPTIQDQVTSTQGSWKICFAAIPGKTMTIYYYQDNLTVTTPPWKPLVTTTENGLACATTVDFSAVYAPIGVTAP
jgi:hypothetical protein